MTYNDLLKRISFAFGMSYETIIKVFALSGYTIKLHVLVNMLKKEEDPAFQECSPIILEHFLDGLITWKRGEKPGNDSKPQPERLGKLNNNIILRKLKIALALKDFEVVEILKLADFKVTKSEINALLQRPSHHNYQPCGDQLLRNFLVGLTEKLRQVYKRKETYNKK
jgi:uncharacterized protein YehS (DUF1456 family)